VAPPLPARPGARPTAGSRRRRGTCRRSARSRTGSRPLRSAGGRGRRPRRGSGTGAGGSGRAARGRRRGTGSSAGCAGGRATRERRARGRASSAGTAATAGTWCSAGTTAARAAPTAAGRRSSSRRISQRPRVRRKRDSSRVVRAAARQNQAPRPAVSMKTGAQKCVTQRGEEERRGGPGEVLGVELDGRGVEEVARVVDRHQDHDQAAERVDRRDARRAGGRLGARRLGHGRGGCGWHRPSSMDRRSSASPGKRLGSDLEAPHGARGMRYFKI
jgi:hypothetical protein